MSKADKRRRTKDRKLTPKEVVALILQSKLWYMHCFLPWSAVETLLEDSEQEMSEEELSKVRRMLRRAIWRAALPLQEYLVKRKLDGQFVMICEEDES